MGTRGSRGPERAASEVSQKTGLRRDGRSEDRYLGGMRSHRRTVWGVGSGCTLHRWFWHRLPPHRRPRCIWRPWDPGGGGGPSTRGGSAQHGRASTQVGRASAQGGRASAQQDGASAQRDTGAHDVCTQLGGQTEKDKGGPWGSKDAGGRGRGGPPAPSASSCSQGPRLHSRHNAVRPRALLHL